MLEDRLLIWRFNRGDMDALGRIYEKHKNDLLRLAAALLGDRNTAEDVLNDVFVSFTQRMGDFRLTGHLKNYLATCVANRARDMYRMRQRKKTIALDDVGADESDAIGPRESAIRNDHYRRLSEAMDQIPYDQREVVTLHLVSGMKFRQIASSQDISVNTAKSRYRYGLDKLRSLLDSEVAK